MAPFGKLQKSDFVISAFWLCAFFFALPILQPYEFSRIAALIFTGMAAFSMLAVANKDYEPVKSPLIPAIFALWFWFFLTSTLWTYSIFNSIQHFATFTMMPLAFYSFATSKRAVQIGSICLAGGAIMMALLALLALVQFFMLPDMLVQGGVRYPFANPNSFAALLGLFILPLMAAGFLLKYLAHKIICTGLILIIMAGFTVIQSTGATLALGTGIVLFMLLNIKTIGAARTILFLSLSGMAALAVFYLQSEMLLESLQSRMVIWQAVTAMIEQRPYFGVGFGNFFAFYPEMRLPADKSSAGLMAHNDPLQFWAESGIPAIMLFYTICAVMLWIMIAACRKQTEYHLVVTALFSALFAMILHSHISFNFYVAPLLLTAGIMIGVWLRLTQPAPGKFLLSPEARKNLLFLSLAALTFVSGSFMLSRYETTRAKALALQGDMENYVIAVNNAHTNSFGLNARAYIHAAALPLTALGENPVDKDKTDHAAHLLAKAEQIDPRYPGLWYRKALLARYQGNVENEEHFYRTALYLNPRHLPSRVELANMTLKSKGTRAAYEILMDGVQWTYNYHDAVPYYKMLAQLAKIEGDNAIYEFALHRINLKKNAHRR